MTRYEEIQQKLKSHPKTWLITGVAGFIGSNLLEKLLKLDQIVVGLDNFATGHEYNLDEVKSLVTNEQWKRFTFHEGDICSVETCKTVVQGVDYVLHQAALGSVPRSIADPITTNAANVTGFLNILDAAKNENVKGFTYAASSSTYGDHPALPKVEQNIGNPLSPYAVTKYVNELYASVYARTYSFKSIGLRYFNVFGPRQDPNGAYAAVIPKWASALVANENITINGDGETSRDFCFIENVVQANILSATADDEMKNEVYNIAYGERTSLNELYAKINRELRNHNISSCSNVIYSEFRDGDVRHSLADISKAAKMLGYEPTHSLTSGLVKSVPWYVSQ